MYELKTLSTSIKGVVRCTIQFNYCQIKYTQPSFIIIILKDPIMYVK